MIIFYQIVVPPLPGKALKRQLPFRGDEGLFEESFIEERRMGLELFINRSINAPDLLTNAYSRTFKLKRPKNRTSLAEKVTQKPVVPSSILRDAKPALIFKMWVILYMKWKKKNRHVCRDYWSHVWCGRITHKMMSGVGPVREGVVQEGIQIWKSIERQSISNSFIHFQHRLLILNRFAGHVTLKKEAKKVQGVHCKAELTNLLQPYVYGELQKSD